MGDEKHKVLVLLGDALPGLDGDTSLFEQQEDLLKVGICAFDLVDFLADLEEAFAAGRIVMVQTVADLHRENCEFYEKITAAMMLASWDRILQFYGKNPNQPSDTE